jgi:hypothetical protein
MTSSRTSPNGKTPRPITVTETAQHAGRTARAAHWLVDVAIPRLIPDRLTARLRLRLRDADDRLEQTARRLTRHRFGRAHTDRERDTR